MKRAASFLAIVFALFIVSIAAAQSGNGFDLTWNTIDGGGGTSTGGNFEVSGTIGQAEAGTLSGGSYALVGGFWFGLDSQPNPQRLLYLPLVRK